MFNTPTRNTEREQTWGTGGHFPLNQKWETPEGGRNLRYPGLHLISRKCNEMAAIGNYIKVEDD